KQSTGRRLSQLCPPYATPSSNSSLDYRRSDARIVENGFATSGGLSKSAKVVLTRQHERRTRSDGYWRDFGWSRSSQGHLRGHRDTARRRTGEIRTRQGVGGAHGRSLPAHRHVLSGELWLHPEDVVGRRRYADIRNYRDLPPIMCEQIAHFFQHYKDLEKGKWVTIVKWLDVTGAEKLILEAIARAEKARAKGHAGRRATRARTLPTGARPKAPSKRRRRS